MRTSWAKTQASTTKNPAFLDELCRHKVMFAAGKCVVEADASTL